MSRVLIVMLMLLSLRFLRYKGMMPPGMMRRAMVVMHCSGWLAGT